MAISVAYRSIKVRLTRSLVTVSSVVLAVTFLLVVLGGEISSNAVYKKWAIDSRPAEDANRLRQLLGKPRTNLELLASLQADPAATANWSANLGFPFTAPSTKYSAKLSSRVNGLKPSKQVSDTSSSTINPLAMARAL